MSVATLVLAAAATTVSGSYDCTVDQVTAVSIEGGKATASMIEGLPADSMKFGLEFKGDDASIEWPNSPIQVSGKQTVLPTAPGAGMILAVSPGPCLFTERSCATMVNYAQQADGSLKLLLTPTAVSSDRDHKLRFPFLVSMEGSCSVRKRNQ